MLQETLRLIKEEFQPGAAFNDVARVASFHRIQCSPGIRDAALFIGSFLDKQGIQKEILSLPAAKGASWWSQESFPEWGCRDAELVLTEDGKWERLCSFGECKISLVQRSAPTPPEGVKTSLVYVENALDPAGYEGIDVSGKIVFSRGVPSQIAAIAVDKFGALGVAVDTLAERPPFRDRYDMPNGRQYLGFWPSDISKHKAFGFMLTPRQGDLLRRMCSKKKEVSVYARVDSSFFDGTMEVVSAVIPGKTPEEVVATAHLCHPEPSANDNASGCGTLMEAARALARLIADGRLPRPRRTIRFLWMPEMTGSYAYLSAKEDRIPRTVAAINLDMVGQNQDLCKGTFIVEKPPKALPGFGGDLAEALLRMMLKEAANFSGNHWLSLFRWTVSPFAGGSDHAVWADPAVGVTTPMLIQWPDVFYHTSEDTLDKVDPKSLWLTGSITAAYLYVAATAGPREAGYLAEEMAARFPSEAELALSDVMDSVPEDIRKAKSQDDKNAILSRARRRIETRIGFLEDRKKADVESLLRLAPDSPQFGSARKEACDFIERSAAYLKRKTVADLARCAGLDDVSGLPNAWQPPADASHIESTTLVPQRRFRGTFSGICMDTPPGYEDEAKSFSEKYKDPMPSFYSVQYWADGKRTVADIADLLEAETGFRNDEELLAFVKLQEKRGVFSLIRV